MTKRESWVLRGMLALGAGLTALTLIAARIQHRRKAQKA